MDVVSPLVKICGLTSVTDALSAAKAGANWLGLNFHRPSPRFVDEPTARTIVEVLPTGVEAVGLFVNRETRYILETARRVGFRIVQLHGDEPAEDVRALQDAGFQVVRAFRIGDASAIARMVVWLLQAEDLGGKPDAVLVDAFVASAPGGTGHSISDNLLDLLPPRTEISPLGIVGISRLILAGGLTPENVTARIQRVRPWMVDTASGVESAPGRKDFDQMSAFIQAVQTKP